MAMAERMPITTTVIITSMMVNPRAIGSVYTAGVEFFDEHGWTVWREAVPLERVHALLDEAARLVPAGRELHESIGLSRRSPLIAKQARDPGLAAQARELLGCKRVQLLQDSLLLKPARSESRVEWHQDHTYTGYLDRPAALSLRLALTECTIASGCLRVIDGSHKLGLLGGVRALSDSVT